MRVGIPREIKPGEARVALTPREVATLAAAGHAVVVECDAGVVSGFDDDAYRNAGARIAAVRDEAFDVDLVVKVKELQSGEHALVRAGSTLVGFQQFAIEPASLAAALASGARFVACETIEDDAPDARDRLPVLAAMSRVAGRVAIALATRSLRGADDAPLDGIETIVIGAGAAGAAAALEAARRGARVTVHARSDARFAAFAACPAIETTVFDDARLRAALPTTRLLVGAVLVPGRTSPCLLDRAAIASMPRGAFFVDVGIDQRGIAETSRTTRIDDPFVTIDGVVHCGVPNLPALAPREASIAYSRALAPYVALLVAHGESAFARSRGLGRGLQVADGRIADERLAMDAARPPR